MLLNAGAPPDVAVVKIAPLAADAAVACIALVPLPYNEPFEVKVAAPVPPFVTPKTPVIPTPESVIAEKIGAALFP